MESVMEDVVYTQSQSEPVEPRTRSNTSSISELSSEPTGLEQYNYILSTDSQAQSPLRPILAQTKTRRCRVAPDEKLDEAIQLLRDKFNWSPGEFITALAKSSARKNKRRLENFKQVIFSDNRVVHQLVTSNEAVRHRILDALNWRSSELLLELDRLAALDIYSKYDPSKLDAFLNPDVSALASILEENAPRTLHLLRLLSQPRAKWFERKTQYMARYVLITSILCYTRNGHTATNLPTTLGLHFFTQGTKAREINLLQRLGVTVGYAQVHLTLEKLSLDGAETVTREAHDKFIFTAYDNFEQSENVKSQRLNDQSHFHSVTSGLQLEGVDIPPGGLHQSMLGNKPLRFQQIIGAPGNITDSTEQEVGSSASLASS